MSLIKFVVNQSYSCRSACNYDCIWTYRVISRTEKRLTLVEVNKDEFGRECLGNEFVKGVGEYDGAETCLPHGRYSMSPSIRANQPAKL